MSDNIINPVAFGELRGEVRAINKKLDEIAHMLEKMDERMSQLEEDLRDHKTKFDEARNRIIGASFIISGIFGVMASKFAKLLGIG